jgi:hypothetical protein
MQGRNNILLSFAWWEFSFPSSNLGGSSRVFSSSLLLRWSAPPSVLKGFSDMLGGLIGGCEL